MKDKNEKKKELEDLKRVIEESKNGGPQKKKKKKKKKKDLEDLKRVLEESKNIFVTSYEKMTVSQDFQLRKTIREVGGKYRVIKNNIAAKASEGTPANDLQIGRAHV